MSHENIVAGNTILYGAAYYHEYMPYERLDKDIQLMQEAGLSVVRLGESTWSLFEPEEGRFEFAWMDRIIDRLHKAGINKQVGIHSLRHSGVYPAIQRGHSPA